MTPLSPARDCAASDRRALLALDDNTSHYGVPPAALRVIAEATADGVRGYPSPFADDLRAALARHAGMEADQISTGCGSDDVLDSIFRVFAEPGERIAFTDPTFSMVPVLARRNRLVPCPVPMLGNHDPDPDALVATGAPVIYLCSPNNPTGTTASRASITRVLDTAPGLVVLDEAYAEFAEDSFLSTAGRRRNLLVVRTLSKAFGLAGLRVGWVAGDADRILRIEDARGPYRLGALAEQAAVEVLRDDLEWVRDRAAAARRDRDRLIAALTGIGLAPLPSAANFVLVPVGDARNCAKRMRAEGVAVRAFPSLTGIGDAVRITVAPGPTMERALAALREALT